MARPDNVTPFRPRRPPPKPAGGGSNFGMATHRGRAVLAQGLTLAAFVLSFIFPAMPLSLIGFGLGAAALFIAASHRHGSMPWAQTHHEHVVRTIVIGAAIWTLASLLPMFGAIMVMPTLVIYVVVLIWVAVRTVVGLVLAIMRRPIWRPAGILF
ncbi:MAG: hypothetical protein ABUL55_00170 [Pseudomonadota bacterium]